MPAARTALAAVVLLSLGACAGVDGAGLDSLDPAVRRGANFAQANCASCHALGADADSPDPSAPAFLRIRRNYTRLSLERELRAIPEVGHYLMKPIAIDGGDVDDLIAYIESLG